jgi:hypothetical protein
MLYRRPSLPQGAGRIHRKLTRARGRSTQGGGRFGRSGGMTTDQRSEQRQRKAPPIMVRVTEQEKARIHANAATCGVSAPALLRDLGLGLQTQSVLDQRAILDLLRVSADLGRLGGLLKMWLSNDERLPHGITPDVLRLFRDIEQTQARLRALVEAL